MPTNNISRRVLGAWHNTCGNTEILQHVVMNCEHSSAGPESIGRTRTHATRPRCDGESGASLNMHQSERLEMSWAAMLRADRWLQGMRQRMVARSCLRRPQRGDLDIIVALLARSLMVQMDRSKITTCVVVFSCHVMS